MNQNRIFVLKKITATGTFKHWLVLVIIFISHQILQKGFEIEIEWIDNYLDPLLFSPLILFLYNLELNYIQYKNKPWPPLSNNQIIASTLIFCVFSELVLPKLSSNFTYDLLDILAIIAGSIYFKFSMNNIQIDNTDHIYR